MNEDERDWLLRGKLETLILARLSVRDRRASSARVSKALYAMLARRFSAVEWRERYEGALAALCDARQVDPETLALTPAGTARLKAALGLASAPRAADWREFKAKYLPRLFFADRPAAPRALDLRALVLAERLGVAVPSGGLRPRRQLDLVIEAWLKKNLELPGRVTLATLSAALLGRELGLRTRQKPGAVVRQGVLYLSGARKDTTQALTDALTERWLRGEHSKGQHSNGARSNGARSRAASQEDSSDDTEPQRSASRATANGKRTLDAAFLTRAAVKIERAARGPRARAFDANKVFIASVWESLAADPEIAGLGELGFKALLVEAHRRGLLNLSRADLVSAMDPGDVAASETRHRNATYHFIVTGTSA
jgi:hypothetical protein